MATTVAQAFNEFHDNKLALTANQRTSVTNRSDRVIEYLQKFFPSTAELPVRNIRMIGSAARKTIIRPLTDIDVLAEFSNKDQIFEKYRSDSQSFLYRIRDTLEAKTQVRQIGARGQAVRLFYQDGLHVDIAPVFAWSSGGYALPSGDGSWLTTDPPAQNSWLSKRNTELNGHLIRKCRFIRRWNAAHSKRLGSFHLDVMAATLFTSLGADTREALAVFFENADTYLRVKDPAGYGGDLSDYLTWSARSAVRDSFSSAATRSRKAIAAENSGDHKEAIRLWSVVLGDEFPSYG